MVASLVFIPEKEEGVHRVCTIENGLKCEPFGQAEDLNFIVCKYTVFSQ